MFWLLSELEFEGADVLEVKMLEYGLRRATVEVCDVGLLIYENPISKKITVVERDGDKEEAFTSDIQALHYIEREYGIENED